MPLATDNVQILAEIGMLRHLEELPVAQHGDAVRGERQPVQSAAVCWVAIAISMI